MDKKEIKRFVKRKLFYFGFKKKLDMAEKFSDRVILLDTPRHGNLGDQAISIAELKFLRDFCGDKKIIEFTYDELCFFIDELSSKITDGDILCIHGGGFIGSVWLNEHRMLTDILKRFYKNKIVVFPQTAFFEDGSDDLKAEFSEIVSACRDLTICCREQNTYDLLSDMFGDESKTVLMPDIVTFLKPKMKNDRDGVLLCFRNDKEKSVDPSVTDGVCSILDSIPISYGKTDTVVGKFKYHDRKREVLKKLEQFSKSRLVITDRLHGMLFAAITGTPCIAVDNISRKVSGVYKWIDHLGYVVCVEPEDIDKQLITDFLSKNDEAYSNKELVAYYKCMADLIKG